MDRNTNPFPYWRYADAPNRQGIKDTSNRGFICRVGWVVTALSHLVIDNANWRDTGPDVEAMRRTLGSLTRSEVTNGGVPNLVVDQAHTAELSMWVPFSATS